MAGKMHRCCKCSHKWLSGLPGEPKQCPKCKRKDWTGRHNSSGRLLSVAVAGVTACHACGSTWSSGRAGVTACPFCSVPLGGVAAVDPFDPGGMLGQVVTAGLTACKCTRCGYNWSSRVAVPVACPSCQSRGWSAAKVGLTECKCKRCGNEWSSRVAVPAVCPSCGVRGWSMTKAESKAAKIAVARDKVENPVYRQCAKESPNWGWHRFIDGRGDGFCPICGYNNDTGDQHINAPALTQSEIDERTKEYNNAHRGEEMPGGIYRADLIDEG